MGENIQLNTRTEFRDNSEIVIPNLSTIKDWVLSNSDSNLNITAIVLEGTQNINELKNQLNETKQNMNILEVGNRIDTHDIAHYSLFSASFVVAIIYILIKSDIIKSLCKSKNIIMPVIDQPLESRPVQSAARENVAESNNNT